MGAFFTVFYVGMLLAPTFGGIIASWAGTVSASFDFGAAALLACPIFLWAFHRLTRATPNAKG
jgi:hypothetical protein